MAAAATTSVASASGSPPPSSPFTGEMQSIIKAALSVIIAKKRYLKSKAKEETNANSSDCDETTTANASPAWKRQRRSLAPWMYAPPIVAPTFSHLDYIMKKATDASHNPAQQRTLALHMSQSNPLPEWFESYVVALQPATCAVLQHMNVPLPTLAKCIHAKLAGGCPTADAYSLLQLLHETKTFTASTTTTTTTTIRDVNQALELLLSDTTTTNCQSLYASYQHFHGNVQLLWLHYGVHQWCLHVLEQTSARRSVRTTAMSS